MSVVAGSQGEARGGGVKEVAGDGSGVREWGGELREERTRSAERVGADGGGAGRAWGVRGRITAAGHADIRPGGRRQEVSRHAEPGMYGGEEEVGVF